MTIKNLIKYCLTVMMQLFVIVTFGQSKEIKDSMSGLVYLHTDRSHYITGESILFKAYVLDEWSGQHISPENTLYVVLIDQYGQEVASGNFPLIGYQVAGDILLSKFLTEGKYILIACTNSPQGATPDKLYSKIIEVGKSKDSGLKVDLTLQNKVYASGSQLSADIRFTGRSDIPVAASYTYQLLNNKGEIASGKGKGETKGEGKTNISIQLPEFKGDDSLKLVVDASYKGKNITTGIVIPTPDNYYELKSEKERNELINKFKQLNIQIKTDKLQYSKNEKIEVSINVSDELGNPVVASLSLSALSLLSDSFPIDNDDIVIYSNLDADLSACGSPWHNILSGIDEKDLQAVNMVGLFETGTESVFNFRLRKIFSDCYSILKQTPGYSYTVQEKNDLEKIRKKMESEVSLKQSGYSADRKILDIIKQIKPYQLVGGKIIFATSGITSISHQDGALIVIDGISMGTDISVLNTISTSDVAKITASTHPMDIQRFTGFNGVGVIEIFTKRGPDLIEVEKPKNENKTSTIFWDPEIITDSSGMATVTFSNNQSSEIVISVEGITSSGLAGRNTIRLSVK